MLPCPSSPRRGCRRAACTRRNGAGDVRYAVVLRQPLVHERVVGASADRARCGPRAAMLAKNSSVSRRNAVAQRVVEVREDARDRVTASRLRRYSHWPANCRRALRSADRPASAAPAARARRGRQLAALGARRAALVRNAAPEEERQPRRELEVADAIRRAGAASGGSCSTRNRNSGLTSIRLSATLDAASNPPSTPCPAYRTRAARHSASVTGRRYARRARRREDRLRAAARRRRARLGARPAREDALAARGVAGPRRVERTADFDAAQLRAARASGLLGPRGYGLQKRLARVLRNRVGLYPGT